jgi:hypothetical protein
MHPAVGGGKPIRIAIHFNGAPALSNPSAFERDNLKHLLPCFGRQLLTDIEASDVSTYQLARLHAGASPKTVNLDIGTLRAILRRNRRWSEI